MLNRLKRILGHPIIVSFILTIIISSQFIIALVSRNNPFHLSKDTLKYIFMSQHLGTYYIAPFCWRIGIPALLHLIPGNVLINSFIISLLLLTMTGYFVYLSTFEVTKSKELALLGLIFSMSFGWGTKAPLFVAGLIDTYVIFIISAGYYLILKKKDMAFLVLLTVGAVVKETTLFLIPLYYCSNASRLVDVKWLLKTLAISLLPLSITLGLRLFISPKNLDPSYVSTLPPKLSIVHISSTEYRPLKLLRLIIPTRIHRFHLKMIADYTYSPLGIVGIGGTLFGIAVSRYRKLFLRNLVFFFLIYAQLLFAVNTERLIVQVYPVLTPIGTLGIAYFNERLGGSSLTPWFIFGLLLLVPLGLISKMVFVPFEIQALLFILVTAWVMYSKENHNRTF